MEKIDKTMEYKQYVMQKYDELQMLQYGIGISLGEIDYFNSLTLEQLQEIEQEIDREIDILEQEQKDIDK